MEQGLTWLSDIKEKYNVQVITDLHECWQAAPVAKVCDYLQIPAFLCRQTDLLTAAVETGRAVNVKKGQFLAPGDTKNIVTKAKEVAGQHGLVSNIMLTERGSSFGYGNLVVDMRSFQIMARNEVPVIFDITHSLQLPGAGGNGDVSGGQRDFAPLLARSATATGYLSGYFIEIHTDPKNAKSDAATQVSIEQGNDLLSQIIPLWHYTNELKKIDDTFS